MSDTGETKPEDKGKGHSHLHLPSLTKKDSNASSDPEQSSAASRKSTDSRSSRKSEDAKRKKSLEEQERKEEEERMSKFPDFSLDFYDENFQVEPGIEPSIQPELMIQPEPRISRSENYHEMQGDPEQAKLVDDPTYDDINQRTDVDEFYMDYGLEWAKEWANESLFTDPQLLPFGLNQYMPDFPEDEVLPGSVLPVKPDSSLETTPAEEQTSAENTLSAANTPLEENTPPEEKSPSEARKYVPPAWKREIERSRTRLTSLKDPLKFKGDGIRKKQKEMKAQMTIPEGVEILTSLEEPPNTEQQTDVSTDSPTDLEAAMQGNTPAVAEELSTPDPSGVQADSAMDYQETSPAAAGQSPSVDAEKNTPVATEENNPDAMDEDESPESDPELLAKQMRAQKALEDLERINNQILFPPEGLTEEQLAELNSHMSGLLDQHMTDIPDDDGGAEGPAGEEVPTLLQYEEFPHVRPEEHENYKPQRPKLSRKQVRGLIRDIFSDQDEVGYDSLYRINYRNACNTGNFPPGYTAGHTEMGGHTFDYIDSTGQVHGNVNYQDDKAPQSYKDAVRREDLVRSAPAPRAYIVDKALRGEINEAGWKNMTEEEKIEAMTLKRHQSGDLIYQMEQAMRDSVMKLPAYFRPASSEPFRFTARHHPDWCKVRNHFNYFCEEGRLPAHISNYPSDEESLLHAFIKKWGEFAFAEQAKYVSKGEPYVWHHNMNLDRGFGGILKAYGGYRNAIEIILQGTKPEPPSAVVDKRLPPGVTVIAGKGSDKNWFDMVKTDVIKAEGFMRARWEAFEDAQRLDINHAKQYSMRFSDVDKLVDQAEQVFSPAEMAEQEMVQKKIDDIENILEVSPGLEDELAYAEGLVCDKKTFRTMFSTPTMGQQHSITHGSTLNYEAPLTGQHQYAMYLNPLPQDPIDQRIYDHQNALLDKHDKKHFLPRKDQGKESAKGGNADDPGESYNSDDEETDLTRLVQPRRGVNMDWDRADFMTPEEKLGGTGMSPPPVNFGSAGREISFQEFMNIPEKSEAVRQMLAAMDPAQQKPRTQSSTGTSPLGYGVDSDAFEEALFREDGQPLAMYNTREGQYYAGASGSAQPPQPPPPPLQQPDPQFPKGVFVLKKAYQRDYSGNYDPREFEYKVQQEEKAQPHQRLRTHVQPREVHPHLAAQYREQKNTLPAGYGFQPNMVNVHGFSVPVGDPVHQQHLANVRLQQQTRQRQEQLRFEQERLQLQQEQEQQEQLQQEQLLQEQLLQEQLLQEQEQLQPQQLAQQGDTNIPDGEPDAPWEPEWELGDDVHMMQEPGFAESAFDELLGGRLPSYFDGLPTADVSGGTIDPRLLMAGPAANAQTETIDPALFSTGTFAQVETSGIDPQLSPDDPSNIDPRLFQQE